MRLGCVTVNILVVDNVPQLFKMLLPLEETG